ncbi:hypothetical protein H0H93_012853 [Arthromyces matolae]|nr:hypothetical protein H0H93_012853 [Arthromyces matolae]
MTTVISRLNPETPPDSRPAGEWVEKDAMRFRNANVVSDTLVDILKEPSQFWEGLETLLRRLVPGTASDEFIVDVSSDPLGF